MAAMLWGRVLFRDDLAGILQQDPSGRYVFTYDPAYLAQEPANAIAHTLPLREEPFISEVGLHPFFDNLVAEGWFQNAQARALGVDPSDRFALLLAFGRDLAGAVAVIDPAPSAQLRLDAIDPDAVAALASRASLSGIQRKLLVVRHGNGYRPAGPNELSTHIAKLPSGQLTDIVELEFLTTLASRALLPDDSIVELDISSVRGIDGPALVIPRFDRVSSGLKIHFEEFNQLLGRRSGDDKYNGAYEDMGRFIGTTPGCLPAEADRLYRRVLTCLLLGNTDAHFKNFAMFHTRDGLRLTPAYDLVAASIYREYQTIALSVAGARNLNIGALQPKHIVALGEGFSLPTASIMDAIAEIEKRLGVAKDTVVASKVGTMEMRDELISRMDKRWNGSFASIGRLLSKKQSKGGRRKTLRSSG